MATYYHDIIKLIKSLHFPILKSAILVPTSMQFKSLHRGMQKTLISEAIRLEISIDTHVIHSI